MFNMLNKKSRGCGGFTLVELIVVLALLMVVMMAAFNFLNGTQMSYRKITDQVGAQSQMRLVMDEIDRRVSTAGTVLILTSPANAVGLSSGYSLFGVDSVTDAFFISGVNEKNYAAVDGMTVQFASRTAAYTSDGDQTPLLHVTLTCTQGYSLERDIYMENTTVSATKTGAALAVYPVS